jgi:hypothetical protein
MISPRLASRRGDLDRRGRHPEFGEVTLSQLLASWVAHDLTHLAQIGQVIGPPLPRGQRPVAGRPAGVGGRRRRGVARAVRFARRLPGLHATVKARSIRLAGNQLIHVRVGLFTGCEV